MCPVLCVSAGSYSGSATSSVRSSFTKNCLIKVFPFCIGVCGCVFMSPSRVTAHIGSSFPVKTRDGFSLWVLGWLPLRLSLTPWLIISRETVLFISYWPYCANWEICSYQPLYKPFLVSVSIFPSQHSSLEQCNCILFNVLSLLPTRYFLRPRGCWPRSYLACHSALNCDKSLRLEIVLSNVHP